MQQQTHMQAPTSTTKKHKGPRKHPQRITQLQCLDNNSQLQLFFVQAINESFKYLPNVLSKIYNQIQLLVGLVQWRVTVGADRPHPGDLLQNIKYKQSTITPKIKLLYLLLSTILPYLKRKLSTYLLQDPTGWKQKALKVLTFVDKILMTLSLINFSVFIRYGKYRSLTQRLLRIPMEFINEENARVLDFTLMNRRIIWTVYQLFLKTIIPSTYELFGPTLKNIFYLNSYLEVESEQHNNCMYCQQRVRLPVKADCGHVACYYCYSVENQGDRDGEEGQQKGVPKGKCRSCGRGVKKWEKVFVKE